MPFLLFCAYVFVLVGRPQDYLPALVPLRLALVLTPLTAAVTLAQGREASMRAIASRETRLYLLFFAVMCAGIPFSLYRRASFNFVMLGYVVNLAFYLMFVVHVNTLERLKRVIVVLVLATFVLDAMWLSRGVFYGGRYVMPGSQMYDPNDIAFVEVSLLSFGLCVILGSYGRLVKSLALTTVLLSILLILFTGSRGAAVGLGVWLSLFFVLPMTGVTRFRKIVLLAAATVLAVSSADKINLDRFQTLTNLQEDYNASDEFGRAEIWKKALHLISQSPVTGVGVSCFSQSLGELREQQGLTPKWQDAHNSYVQVTTETGVIGGGAFLLLVGTSLLNLNRMRKERALGREKELTRLSALLLIGFAAMAASGFFLTQAYSVLFSLFFALSASLRAIEENVSCEVAAHA